MIEVKKVCKTYNISNESFNALDTISFNVNKGEFVAIVGTSGSGKSTILNLIGGLDKPTSGEILIDSKNIYSQSSKELAKFRNEKIGFIFQSFKLLNEYNLIDNISLPIKYSSKKSSAFSLGVALLSKLGLKEHQRKTPDKLSGGQKQRVAIGRAIINNPEIILADEPTGALDSNTGIMILDMLKELNSEGKTVIIVTHDMNIAKNCNRIIKFEDGKIISDSILNPTI